MLTDLDPTTWDTYRLTHADWLARQPRSDSGGNLLAKAAAWDAWHDEGAALGLSMGVSFAGCRAWLAKSNPNWADQPRVGAGSSGGGRWTAGGETSDSEGKKDSRKPLPAPEIVDAPEGAAGKSGRSKGKGNGDYVLARRALEKQLAQVQARIAQIKSYPYQRRVDEEVQRQVTRLQGRYARIEARLAQLNERAKKRKVKKSYAPDLLTKEDHNPDWYTHGWVPTAYGAAQLATDAERSLARRPAPQAGVSPTAWVDMAYDERLRRIVAARPAKAPRGSASVDAGSDKPRRLPPAQKRRTAVLAEAAQDPSGRIRRRDLPDAVEVQRNKDITRLEEEGYLAPRPLNMQLGAADAVRRREYEITPKGRQALLAEAPSPAVAKPPKAGTAKKPKSAKAKPVGPNSVADRVERLGSNDAAIRAELEPLTVPQLRQVATSLNVSPAHGRSGWPTRKADLVDHITSEMAGHARRQGIGPVDPAELDRPGAHDMPGGPFGARPEERTRYLAEPWATPKGAGAKVSAKAKPDDGLDDLSDYQLIGVARDHDVKGADQLKRYEPLTPQARRRVVASLRRKGADAGAWRTRSDPPKAARVAIDESVPLARDPEGDNSLMHGDSPTMGLAQRYARAGRPGSANKMMDLRRRATTSGSDGITPQQVVDELRAWRAQETDPNFQSQIDDAISRIDAPMTPMPQLPPDTPPLARKFIEDLHAIPRARKGDRAVTGDGHARGPAMVEQVAQVYRDVAAGKRGEDRLDPRSRLGRVLRGVHESDDSSYRIWEIERRLHRDDGSDGNSAQSQLAQELRQWERGRLSRATPETPASKGPATRLPVRAPRSLDEYARGGAANPGRLREQDHQAIAALTYNRVAHIDELVAKGASDKALQRAIVSGTRGGAKAGLNQPITPEQADWLLESWRTGGRERLRTALRELGAAHGVHLTQSAGAVEPFDTNRHGMIGPHVPAGMPVTVVRPGATYRPESGADRLLARADVQATEPGLTAKPPKAAAKSPRGGERAALAKDYVKRYVTGESINDIAESDGRSYGFVHRMLSESGVQLRGRGGVPRKRRK